LPDINQRVSFHQDWIREAGCALSEEPPADWNCASDVTNSPVATPTTQSPVVVAAPTRQPTPAVVTTLPPNNNQPPIPIPAQQPIEAPDGIVSVYVIINFDSSPRDIAWFISDDDYEEFRVGAPWGAYQPNRQRAEELVYLKAGDDYRFTIEDLRGNGLSGGDYRVVLGGIDGPVLVQGGGNFGDEETSFFSIPPPASE
jgi:hypothetical protein